MPSANMAVTMANLDRLPDTPECQGVRSSIRAHLIAAMGQTTTLLKRVQAVSHTEVSSDQTHRSRTSPRPSGHHHSRSPAQRSQEGRWTRQPCPGHVWLPRAEARARSGSKLRQGLLGILNANRKIRKRTDTDVAFTREYSRVSIFHRERECTN